MCYEIRDTDLKEVEGYKVVRIVDGEKRSALSKFRYPAHGWMPKKELNRNMFSLPSLRALVFDLIGFRSVMTGYTAIFEHKEDAEKFIQVLLYTYEELNTPHYGELKVLPVRLKWKIKRAAFRWAGQHEWPAYMGRRLLWKN